MGIVRLMYKKKKSCVLVKTRLFMIAVQGLGYEYGALIEICT